jgi:hypothetical protein
MRSRHSSHPRRPREHPRSLPVNEWPEADQHAWEGACRPGSQLRPGGAASRLAEVSRNDFAQRYGAFLGFLQRSNRLEKYTGAAAQVTATNVDAYMADLKVRVSSVTVWNCIYKLRRAAELLVPQADFSWLAEIEKDFALVMRPRSKFDRLVFATRLVEAGMTLVEEAERFARNDLARARDPQRAHGCAPCTLSSPFEKLCRFGDRGNVQRAQRKVVDRPPGRPYKNWPPG